MEFYFTMTELIKIDLIWKIFISLAILIILWHIFQNDRIKKEYSHSTRTILDEGGSKTQEDIRKVTDHFIASIKEGSKWCTDGRSLGEELVRHWDHRCKYHYDVKFLSASQRTKLKQSPCKFFSDYGCSEYMDAIMQATAKYSQQ